MQGSGDSELHRRADVGTSSCDSDGRRAQSQAACLSNLLWVAGYLGEFRRQWTVQEVRKPVFQAKHNWESRRKPEMELKMTG